MRVLSSSSLIFRRFLKVVAEPRTSFLGAGLAFKEPKPVPNKNVTAERFQLDESLEKRLENGELKAKHHPGLRSRKIIDIPEDIQVALFSIVGKYQLEDIRRASAQFVHHLMSRLPPIETDELRLRAGKIERFLRSKNAIDSDNPTQEEQEFYEETIRHKLYSRLRKTFYHWEPIEYDGYTSLLYLFARFPAEYAVLTRIFSELKIRDPAFKPEYLLDIGSGLCSVLWATRPIWGKDVQVALCVDTSPDMNKVAKLLMRGGLASGRSDFEGVFFKPFIPYADENVYDLVTCAYSLMEMPNQNERIKMYTEILSKMRKYAVIVENGTTGGFQLIHEAREFFVSQDNIRILAPCPHMKACPRISSQELRRICSFNARYSTVRLITQKQRIVSERYSYLIIEKITDQDREDKQKNWPRVLHSAPRSRHVHLHMCCPDGAIRQRVLTKKKSGKHTYKCGTYCKPGDMLPCTLQLKPTAETGELE